LLSLRPGILTKFRERYFHFAGSFLLKRFDTRRVNMENSLLTINLEEKCLP